MNRFFVETDLDLDVCLTTGQVFRWQRAGDGWVGVDGKYAYELRPTATGVSVVSNAGEPEFRTLFGLEPDLTPRLRSLAAGDPPLAGALARCTRFRAMRPSCPRETLFCFLCSANNHIRRTTAMVGRLAELGEPISTLGGHPLRRFPGLDGLAAKDESHWRRAGFGYRAPHVPALAREVQRRGGDAWLAELRQVPWRDARRALLALPGIGPKLADCVALFGLGHGAATPIDTHMWSLMTADYFPEWRGRTLTAARYEALGDRLRESYGDLAGIAHSYLFADRIVATRAKVPCIEP